MSFRDFLEEEMNEAKSKFVASCMKGLEGYIKSNKDDFEEWCQENNYDAYDGLDAIKGQNGKAMESQFASMEAKGWTANDAVQYMKYSEEINPTLSEDRALKLMKKLSDKYGGSKGKR